MSATETTTIPTGTWSIDAVHSSVGFEVKHLGVSTFRGSFKDVTGSIETDNGAVTAIDGTIETASIHTIDGALSGHLQTPDFFDTANHPQGHFRSTQVEDLGDGKLRIRGELELRGVTKPGRDRRARSPAPAPTRTGTSASACPARPSSTAPSSASPGTRRCRTAA